MTPSFTSEDISSFSVVAYDKSLIAQGASLKFFFLSLTLTNCVSDLVVDHPTAELLRVGPDHLSVVAGAWVEPEHSLAVS